MYGLSNAKDLAGKVMEKSRFRNVLNSRFRYVEYISMDPAWCAITILYTHMKRQ